MSTELRHSHTPHCQCSHTLWFLSAASNGLSLAHSPTLTRFHSHYINWKSVSDMQYDARQRKMIRACIQEHVSDSNLLKIVHFRRVQHHKNHHAGWKWKWSPDSKWDYSIFWGLHSLWTVSSSCGCAVPPLPPCECFPSVLTRLVWVWGWRMSSAVIGWWRWLTKNCMMCRLLWDRVRQMWVFGDCFWRCELFWCQENSVLLWWSGCRRREKLCCNKKCVRFSHGCQWRLRQRAAG